MINGEDQLEDDIPMELAIQEAIHENFMANKQRQTRVPIPSDMISDMAKTMLADQMQRLSIHDVRIYEINSGDHKFTNPWQNRFTYQQRRRYTDLWQGRYKTQDSLDTLSYLTIKNQGICECEICASTEIKI